MQHATPGLGNRLLKGWKERNPILKFALGFCLLMGIFYGFWFSDIFIDNVLTPVVNANAAIAGNFLNLFGYETTITGPKITSSAFSISINKGCDALEPMAIFLFAVLLFPAPLKAKLIGLAFGIPFLFFINQLRIITLYLIGVHTPDIMGDSFIFFFDIMHVQVWQVVFILITLVLLSYWILWTIKKEKLNKETSAHAIS